MKNGRSVNLSVALVFLIVLAPQLSRADAISSALINLSGAITGYDGTGVIVGQIEPGAPTNHLDIIGNLIGTTVLPNGTAGDNHATEVASVIVSTSVVTRGVAPGASLYSVAAGTVGETIDGIWLLATQQNVRVINMSAGQSSVTGVVSGVDTNGIYVTPSRVSNASGNELDSRAIDALVAARKITFVVAAGNEGLFGTNTVGPPAAAYNIISVGAVSNLAVGTSVADFSSRGYLASGRSGLDIVAPGADIAMSGYEVSTNISVAPPLVFSNNVGSATKVSNIPDSFAGPAQNPLTRVSTNSGTSFAAPMVAGVAARLVQYGNTLIISNEATDPRTIKAVLLNSATKLSGWGQGAVVGGTPGLQGTMTGGVTQVRQPLDPNQGAGLLNANGAFLQLAAGRKSPTVQQNGFINIVNTAVNLTNWDFNGVKLALTNFYQVGEKAMGNLSITLDWSRDVGPTVAGTNSILGMAKLTLSLLTSPDLPSPLDLSFGLTNLTLVAQSTSSIDNLQHLWFTNAPSAYYVIAVSYDNYNSQGGATPGSIDYGLAWSLAAVPEPSTLILTALGLIGVWRWRRRGAG